MQASQLPIRARDCTVLKFDHLTCRARLGSSRFFSLCTLPQMIACYSPQNSNSPSHRSIRPSLGRSSKSGTEKDEWRTGPSSPPSLFSACCLNCRRGPLPRSGLHTDGLNLLFASTASFLLTAITTDRQRDRERETDSALAHLPFSLSLLRDIACTHSPTAPSFPFSPAPISNAGAGGGGGGDDGRRTLVPREEKEDVRLKLNSRERERERAPSGEFKKRRPRKEGWQARVRRRGGRGDSCFSVRGSLPPSL